MQLIDCMDIIFLLGYSKEEKRSINKPYYKTLLIR